MFDCDLDARSFPNDAEGEGDVDEEPYDIDDDDPNERMLRVCCTLPI